MTRFRIAIADDHHLVVEGLRAALSKTHEIVAVAYEGAEVIAVVSRHAPDVLLLDLSLPDRNGLELIPQILQRSPSTRIVIVTMHLDRVLAESAFRAGAKGFVPKDSGMDEVEAAITTVMAGQRYLSPRVPPVTNRMSLDAKHPALGRLTPRQHNILELIGDGMTSAEIGRRLGLAERTIAFHRTNIRNRLGVDSEHGLMRFALMLRLGEPDAV